MYTGTFNFMLANKNKLYYPVQIPLHTCPAHHQFEGNLISWRLAISEIDNTEIVIIIDGHTIPWHLADRFCKPTTKIPYTLVWFRFDFFLTLHYKILLDE